MTLENNIELFDIVCPETICKIPSWIFAWALTQLLHRIFSDFAATAVNISCVSWDFFDKINLLLVNCSYLAGLGGEEEDAVIDSLYLQ